MISILLTVFFGIVVSICFNFANWEVGNLWTLFNIVFIGGFLSHTFLFSFGYMIIGNLCIYFDQINSIERIKERQEKKEIYLKKASALTDQFKTYLVEKYPEHEMKIFKNLSSQNVTLLATLFPEIKASDTIKNYCSRINSLQNDVYDQDLKIAELKRAIRVRSRDITRLGLFLPNK